ncbi:hypothetical protein L1987_10296 [Smallanthus sonchifolius]|uniref:Uncharacterized protein n=1 Tax=Smallanthus sonchifolius TaxID=185202 RepID=A0ACB9JRU8_9ASTR|nr:hypothetical protein L1987_10296 [Smallanthus sonchifolius]
MCNQLNLVHSSPFKHQSDQGVKDVSFKDHLESSLEKESSGELTQIRLYEALPDTEGDKMHSSEYGAPHAKINAS